MNPAAMRASALAVFGCIALGVLGALLAFGCALLYYLQSSPDLPWLPSLDFVVNSVVLIGLGAAGLLVPAIVALLVLPPRHRWAVVGAMVGAVAVAIAVLGLLVV